MLGGPGIGMIIAPSGRRASCPAAGTGLGGACRVTVGEGALLQQHVGMQILVRCLDGLMTEPECDDGEVDPVLKKCHGGGMAKGMRRDPAAL